MRQTPIGMVLEEKNILLAPSFLMSQGTGTSSASLLGLSSNKLQLFFSDAILFWPETADFNKSHLLVQVEEGCSTMLEIQNNASIKYSGSSWNRRE
ncbi:hypothetical protein OUZ56_020790 [Daphnia magna]|uniref:Uncharacterized protein n=1 Tax=Daphnia magna TaxID=35525 RepID=A0ABQ9ZFG5_9CRUS|nr:hypothetical protein OUZ56_020790 [Daphnia magna]